MMQFVRTGPELILIKPADEAALDRYLIKAHKAYVYRDQDLSKAVNFHALFDQVRDNSTLLLIVEDFENALKNHMFLKIYITHSDISTLMMGMLNADERLIDQIRRMARVLFLKTVGDIDRVIQSVAKDLKGRVVDAETLYELNDQGAIIHFTPESLDKTLHFDELYPQAIYVEKDGREAYFELNKRAIRYVNVGLHNQFWYELDIKIYDAYGHYESHYDRLQYVLNKLDIGVLAGETWGTDAAMSFWSVDTYNLRLFTYMEPKAFKSILLGLEYAVDGERKVDLDLYYRKRKISWSQVREKRKMSRDELGMECRQKIYDQLDEADKAYLKNLENKIKSAIK